MFARLYKSLVTKYRQKYWSLEKQALYAGVSIGSNCFVKSRFWSTEPYLISIGNNCAITSGVKIFTHGGGRIARKTYPLFDCFGKVTIGNSVYIGTNSLIMPGVSIGNNVLIAAGSVVTKSIPDNVVVGGNPAIYICSIEEYIKRNLKYNLDSKGMNPQEKREMLLNTDETKLISKPFLKVLDVGLQLQ